MAINAFSEDGDIRVTSSDLVSTQGLNATGIVTRTAGDVTIAVSDVATAGDGATAIVAEGGSANLAVAGTVSTSGAGSTGLFARHRRCGCGDGGAVATSGADAAGIDAEGSAAVTVDAARVTTAGRGSTGIAASSTGGDAAVRAGSVRASDADAGAIRVSSAGGAASVAVTGAARSDSGVGVRLDAGGEARLTLAGASDFGAGAHRLDNRGTVRLGTTGFVQVVSVAGLEALNNSGTIDLRNGVMGHRLVLAGTALTGSGEAALALDLAFANRAATADRLAVGSAAGSTAVTLATSGTPTLIAPVTLVEESGASNAGAFAFAGGSSEHGLIALGIARDAAGGASQLVSAPGSAVYRQAQLGEALTTVWNRSADAVGARFAAGRDAAATGTA